MPIEALRKRHHLTIQARIAWLVVACIIPAWLLAAFVTFLSYERERTNIRQHTLAMTREIMRMVERDMGADEATAQTLAQSSNIDRGERMVERDLGADEATAQTLAQSSNIDRGDFAAFQLQAKEVLRFTSAYTIALTDTSGQQLVNLLQPYGAPLPRDGSPELLRRTLDLRKPVVSDLFIGNLTKIPLLAI